MIIEAAQVAFGCVILGIAWHLTRHYILPSTLDNIAGPRSPSYFTGKLFFFRLQWNLNLQWTHCYRSLAKAFQRPWLGFPPWTIGDMYVTGTFFDWLKDLPTTDGGVIKLNALFGVNFLLLMHSRIPTSITGQSPICIRPVGHAPRRREGQRITSLNHEPYEPWITQDQYVYEETSGFLECVQQWLC